MYSKFDFTQGQCFNFAYAMCHLLQGGQNISDQMLVSATGIRKKDEDVEFVCIHCVVKIYHLSSNCFICLDSQGAHPEDYLADVVEEWKNVELELNSSFEEVNIMEYDFSSGASSYWADLEMTGARISLNSVAFAKQYILDNIALFGEVIPG